MEILASKFQQLENSLKEIKKALLVIHPNPDADALGTVFTLQEYLKTKKIKTTIFSVDKPSNDLSKLFPVNDIKNGFNLKKFDSIFFLDRGDVYFKLGFDKELEKNEDFKKIKIINIDHHWHTFIPGKLNIIDTSASATSEIIYRFFDYIEFNISQKISQYLLNGIFADTGGFRHSNTSPLSLEISAELLKKGASLSKINKELFAKKSIHAMKLWAIALERARINPKTGMVVSFITKEDLKRCGASEKDISGISEILNTIADSNFSLVLSEHKNDHIKASLRSEAHKGVDVSKIARHFKGGGHKLASGFEIKGKLKQVGSSWIIE